MALYALNAYGAGRGVLSERLFNIRQIARIGGILCPPFGIALGICDAAEYMYRVPAQKRVEYLKRKKITMKFDMRCICGNNVYENGIFEDKKQTPNMLIDGVACYTFTCIRCGEETDFNVGITAYPINSVVLRGNQYV
jgi:hypothetical protein